MYTYIIGLFQTIFYVVLCDLFFSIFSKSKKRSFSDNITIMALLVLNYGITITANNWVMVKELGIIVCTSFIFWRIYCIKYYKAFITTLLYQSVCMVVEYITIIYMRRLFNISIDITDASITNSLLGLLCQIIAFLILIILRKRLSESVRESLTQVEWIIFSIFPLFTIFAIISMIVKFKMIEKNEQEKLLVIIANGLLLLNIIIYFLLNMIVKREEELADSRLLREKTNNQMKMYYSIAENYEKQKRKSHEFNNHMTCIMSLARQGDIARLNKYLNDMQIENIHETDYLDTNNVLVNAILNSKYSEARQKGITFAFKVNNLMFMPLSDEDIVIILSNLLNNAFEACEYCEKKVIQLKLVMNNNKLIISLINTKSGNIILKDGKLLTTKNEDKEYHGIGIENVIEAVKRNEGEYAIKYDDKQFQFSIMIPIKEK